MPRPLETALLFCITSQQPQKHLCPELNWLRRRYQQQTIEIGKVIDASAHALVAYTPLSLWSAFHRRQPYALRIAPAPIFRTLAAYLDGEISEGFFLRSCLALQIAHNRNLKK